MSEFIEIKLPKYLLVLTEAELRRLLSYDPGIWTTAIKRGKGVQRERAARERKAKMPARCNIPPCPRIWKRYTGPERTP